MGFFGKIDEAIKSFKTAGKGEKLTDKQIEARSGEGIETVGNVDGFSVSGLSSFNSFYSTYLNKQYKNEKARIYNYRNMMGAPEISDVVEDAVNESSQEDDEGYSIFLNINDESINKKETAVKTLNNEFYDLFYNKVNIGDNLWDLLYTYFVDGRVYFENIINQNRKLDGIVNIKKLPSETMDYIYDYKHSKVEAYLQYKKPNVKKPQTLEEAEKDNDVIVFYPNQISFIPYQYGNDKHTIIGYLEKAKVAYNQLKLLETSMVIYRIVRAPERFVFKIDVGNMPREKAMKYVEKVKRKMNRKESFDPNTGTLLNNTEILSIQDNFFIPSSESRGSDISTVGGSNIGFSELDDVYYFAKKLYRALKYPMTRIENRQENRSGDNLFRGQSTGEITLGEIKWAKFLERQQNKFSKVFRDLFLLHLEFKGIKKTYGLSKDNISVSFIPPSDYREQMEQQLLQTRFDNYMTLSNEPEFSKKWLMMRYLQLTEEEIKENADMKKEDKKLGFKEEDGMGF